MQLREKAEGGLPGSTPPSEVAEMIVLDSSRNKAKTLFLTGASRFRTPITTIAWKKVQYCS